jgi:hypothetical protein
VGMQPQDPGAGWAADGGHVRAGDADREQVIGVLTDAFVQGRLSRSKLARRTGQALESKTYAELARATAGIPAGRAASPPPRRTTPDRARPVRWKAVGWVLGMIIVLPGLGIAFFATYYGSFFILLLIGLIASAMVRLPESPTPR